MAYIKVNTKYPLYDGMPLTFKAPCDCTAVDGITVKSQTFVFKDAHGNTLTGIGNLFEKDAYVKVILDTNNNYAYIQNADTNSYLEKTTAKVSDVLIDTEVAYTKDIPGNSAPYAQINKIGGMTYKDGNTLKSAPVTEVESVGANLIPYPYVDTTKTQAGITFTDNGDGSVTMSGTATANATFTYATSLILKHGQAYFLSTDVILAYKDANGNTKYESGGFVWDDSYTFVRIYSQVVNGVSASKTVYPAVNKGSTALPYRPYTKNTLEIPEAVRPENGINENVYDYIDFEKMQFIQRVGVVDLGSLSWTKNTGNQFLATLPTGTKTAYTTNHLCAKYETSARGAYNNVGDKIITLSSSAAWVIDTEHTSATTIKPALNGVMLYYGLAEPIITDISDKLPADNLIAVEGGGTMTFKNEHEFAVPSEVEIYANANKVVGANKFIGNLLGVAERAIADKNGNDIAELFAQLVARIATLETENGIFNVGANVDGKTLTITCVADCEQSDGENYDVLNFGNGNYIEACVDVGYYQGYGVFDTITDTSNFGSVTYTGGGVVTIYNKNYVSIKGE